MEPGRRLGVERMADLRNHEVARGLRWGALAALFAVSPITFAQEVATGELYVEASEAGARVYIDGEQVEGVTPLMVSDIAAGSHEVVVTTGCGRAEAQVDVRAGLIERLDLTLEEGLGELRLSSMPGNAEVTLGGESMGSTPIILRDLACGAHEVTLSADGYVDSIEQVEVESFQSTRHHVMLRPRVYGDLVVSVNPLDTEVWVDGELYAVGPVTVENLLAGEHWIGVRLEGYVDKDFRMDIEGEVVQRLEVTMDEVEPMGDYYALPVPIENGEPRPPGETPEANDVEPSSPPPATPMVDDSEPVANPADAPAPVAASGGDTSARGLGLKVGVTAVGLGSGIWGLVQYGTALDAYQRYLDVPDDSVADEIYQDEVLPARTSAMVFGGLGVATLGVAAYLWMDDGVSVSVDDRGFYLHGSW